MMKVLCSESRRKRSAGAARGGGSTSDAMVTTPGTTVSAQGTPQPYWNGSLPTCVGELYNCCNSYRKYIIYQHETSF